MSNLTRSEWETMAASLSINGKAWINGKYTDAESGETFDCQSPVDGRHLASIASCDSADVNKAVSVARNTFESGEWSELSPVRRKKTLQAFAALMEENAQELALLETLDMGKPISESLNDDITGSVNSIRWCAEAIDKLYDEVAPTENDVLGLVTREPVGVVAAVVPWNFPLNMACWKLGPALAAGNSVILKPSEKSPLTAIRIAELAEQAGLPKGVLQVLPGFGHTAGKALALHNDVDCIAFTGSTAVAKQLQVYAGESNMKRVWLEAGGKSPQIVFADCENLDKAASVAAMAIGYNQGEVCTAASRLLVERSIYDEFMELVKHYMHDWHPGHPLDPQTSSGAIVDQIQTTRVLDYIESGKQGGARLTFGGRQVMQETGGFYIEPTVFEGVDNTMAIAREEIFGPVLSAIAFDTEEEAVQIANDTIYGLAAALWTDNLGRAHRVSKRLRAGSVFVNNYHGGDMTVPFGGFKQSGNGRDKSLHAFDKYTELKTTWVALS
ncbi:aldehyde dehydrogenase [Endozoicomonas montiporae]|uniref:Aldehyde dehydrogenase n=2 Tax=Endozoicomonas montiporae TaxID=1027273 RepID=A0A081N5A9_9GAMM|nr:aldehyde dehydrogenase [Endozoicomonas montiporae]AMO57485.1 gamma-glutamyl-gamma-aminobutyraldehyde dehydrogenase [Endozoicomonas montiporae CL-33]KEQ13632.1 aldehyde dehydrogenase [Endozoicomonas montiporae]